MQMVVVVVHLKDLRRSVLKKYNDESNNFHGSFYIPAHKIYIGYTYNQIAFNVKEVERPLQQRTGFLSCKLALLRIKCLIAINSCFIVLLK